MALNLVSVFVIGSALSVLAKDCSNESALREVKRPVYEFSVRILDRVREETGAHFVYSPLSTWLQLTALSEGARGRTAGELRKIMRLRGLRQQRCYRRKFREIINSMESELDVKSKMSGVIIIDKLYKVKRTFKNAVQRSKAVKVMSLDFDNKDKSAELVNNYIKSYTDGYIDEIIYPDDFNLSRLILADAGYYKNEWKHPFNPVHTKITRFFNEEGAVSGDVAMMNQNINAKYVEMPLINARVLELPCKDNKVSMLVFLPYNDSIKNLYYNIQRTNLRGILNELTAEGLKPVNVFLPRFKVDSDLELRELLYDMGITRAFYPENNQFKGISDYALDVSLVTQIASIEVTEKEVTASVGPETVIDANMKDVIVFNANKPFGFMLVNKVNGFILFAGIYSEPSVY